MSTGKTTDNINSPVVKELVQPVENTPVTDLKGLFGMPIATVTIDDMNSAIAEKGSDAK